MPREQICQYGNCSAVGDAVSVNLKYEKERPVFCCLEHAGLYLLGRVVRQHNSPGRKAKAEELTIRLHKEYA